MLWILIVKCSKIVTLVVPIFMLLKYFSVWKLWVLMTLFTPDTTGAALTDALHEGVSWWGVDDCAASSKHPPPVVQWRLWMDLSWLELKPLELMKNSSEFAAIDIYFLHLKQKFTITRLCVAFPTLELHYSLMASWEEEERNLCHCAISCLHIELQLIKPFKVVTSLWGGVSFTNISTCLVLL